MFVKQMYTNRAALLKSANEIVETAKAADRDLTPEEVAKCESYIREIRSIDERLEAGRKGDALMARIGGNDPGELRPFGAAPDAGHLSFAGLSDRIVAGMKHASSLASPLSKGLVPAGETVVSIPIVNTVPLPGSVDHERPPRLVEALAVATRPVSYEFLRQSVIGSPGGASVVAPGDVKPTAKLGLERVPSRLRVIAVLSEPQDKFLLEDAANLKTWVASELTEAVLRALETEILTGDGTGEHFRGLANTSGIQTQAALADRISTLAAGLSKLEAQGLGAQLVALSPADWLAIQTTRNASGAFDLGGPIDPSARKVWGTSVVVVPGLAAGTGYIVAPDSVLLATDGAGIRVDWGTPGDSFTRNQVVARVEGRFNLDVPRPHGVVKLALA